MTLLIIFRVLLLLVFLTSTAFPLFANTHDIQIYARGFNYLVIASPTHNVEFTATRDSQRTLSPNILLEDDMSVEEIPIQYVRNGETYKISLLISQNISLPYINVTVLEREALSFGERLTLKISTNVPDRAIDRYVATLNGREIPVIDGKLTFDAYNRHSKVFVQASLLSDRELTITKVLEHEIELQTGCDVLHEDRSLFAVCFSNNGPIQTAQFYLAGTPIGNQYGEAVIGKDVPSDMVLEVMINNSLSKYSIELVDNKLVSIPYG